MVHFHLYQICRRTKNLGGQMSFHLGFGTLCHFSTFMWKHISQTLRDNRSSYEAYILKSVSMKDDKRFFCQSNSSQKSLLYSLGLRNNIKQQVKFFGVDTGQTHYVTQSVLPKAENLSVILTSWYPPAVRVHWRYNFSQIQNSRLKAFQIMYYPSKSRYRIIQEVPHYFTNLTLDRLQPGVEYNLTVNAMSESGTTNDSRVVQFISPDNETRRGHKKFFNRPIHVYPDEIQEGLQVREDEVVIVVLVIIAWIGCLFVFFNKWGKIRMLEPYQPQYKESFHNSIHSIHPKPSRMNTCTSVPPNMISIESRGSLIPDRDLFLHHSRMTESGQLYQCASGTTYHHPAYRPRLNSVFVGNPYHRDSLYPEQNMPRKVKSAEDLKSLVVQVSQNIPSTSTSVL
ncbi:hypothetical protein BLOT_013682 [Blomia tropicalis]|nr:hypothetical protein BLOT_013682 [Blomia tropicalis]